MRFSALRKQVADLAGGTTTVEAPHIVGAAGEPNFVNGWGSRNQAPPSFYKDSERVYLAGWAGVTSVVNADPMFVLPVGYRPAKVVWLRPPVYDTLNAVIQPDATLYIMPSGDVQISQPIDGLDTFVALDGLSFRIA